MIHHSMENRITSDVFFPAPNLSRIHAEIVRLMSGPRRFYHTPEHLEHMTSELRDTGIWTDNPFGVNLKGMLLAIWFHDIIQDPMRGDNEERSAKFMMDMLQRDKDDTNFIHVTDAQVASRLIMATKHDGRKLRHFDEELIHDLDLTILGAAPTEFEAYEQQIRQEYSHFSDEDYRKGRINFLENRLDMFPIFYTFFFQKKYEDQAHANIEKLIYQLKAQN
jgi:predicted metal-dependent HD superfamily phosphohydrolase